MSKPIGLYSDQPGSGKTLFCKYFVSVSRNSIDSGYCTLSQAEPLKEMVRTLLIQAGLSIHDASEAINGRLKETPVQELLGEPTPRRLMQTLGTEWGRELLGERFWLELWNQRRKNAIKQGHTDVICDDIRFTDEALEIKRHGGLIWKIERPGLTTKAETMQHRSQAGIPEDLIDDVIENDAGPEELLKAAKSMFEQLIKV